ncbi:MAG: GYF domain-containing protein [Oligoflexia bacterium]|nr:GYF domain-containing protein [Oligoflexia bacterium]
MTKQLDKNMDRIWFIYDHQTVRGPFDSSEVHKGIKFGQYIDSDLIWKRGYKEWQNLAVWIEKAAMTASQNDVWYINEDGTNHGPFAFKVVVEKLVKNELSLTAKLWTTGLNKWSSVYEISEFMQYLGISRRKHTRAPFVGSIFIDNVKFALTTQCISEGGISGTLNTDQFIVDQTEKTQMFDNEITQIWSETTYVREAQTTTFQIGEELNLKIKSPLLTQTAHVKAKVVYRHSNDLGFQFINVSDEARSSFVEYVKQFEVA